MTSKLSVVSFNIGALLMLSVLTVTTQTAAAQSTNANPDSTTRINVWEFLYYVDNDNNPDTPPIRYTSGPLFSHKDCNERRSAIIESGQQIIGNQYYPIESVERCILIKSPTQETQKFCFEYRLVPTNPDNPDTPPESGLECQNTKELCENSRETFVDRLQMVGYTTEIISDCEINKNR